MFSRILPSHSDGTHCPGGWWWSLFWPGPESSCHPQTTSVCSGYPSASSGSPGVWPFSLKWWSNEKLWRNPTYPFQVNSPSTASPMSSQTAQALRNRWIRFSMCRIFQDFIGITFWFYYRYPFFYSLFGTETMMDQLYCDFILTTCLLTAEKLETWSSEYI